MNWTKALLTSGLFWVLVFFEYAILSMGLDLTGAVFITFFFIFLAIITMICSVVYFNLKGVDTGFGQGFMLGLMFIIIGLILDLAITIPIFAGGDYNAFFSWWYMYVGWGIVLIFSSSVGMAKS